jgi:hypothetical protein
MSRSLFRIARIVAGVLLVILGIIGLFLPLLQGILLIVAGLGLLSVDIPLVRGWRICLVRWVRRKRAAARARRQQRPPEQQAAGGKR